MGLFGLTRANLEPESAKTFDSRLSSDRLKGLRASADVA